MISNQGLKQNLRARMFTLGSSVAELGESSMKKSVEVSVELLCNSAKDVPILPMKWLFSGPYMGFFCLFKYDCQTTRLQPFLVTARLTWNIMSASVISGMVEK